MQKQDKILQQCLSLWGGGPLGCSKSDTFNRTVHSDNNQALKYFTAPKCYSQFTKVITTGRSSFIRLRYERVKPIIITLYVGFAFF